MADKKKKELEEEILEKEKTVSLEKVKKDDTDVEKKDEVVEDETVEVEEEVVEEKVEEYTKEYVDGLLSEIEDLKAQVEQFTNELPQELTPEQIEVQEEKQSIWKERVEVELEKKGLSEFADFINAEVGDKATLQAQIEKIVEILGKMQVDNSYKPTNNKPADAYQTAKKNKDVLSMLKNKL